MSVMFARSRRSKYGAIPTKVDGIRFDSKAEAKRYGELKLMQKAGQIHSLEIHPRYPLFAGCNSVLLGHYVADFAYKEVDNLLFVEDVKGIITPLAKWKIKHFSAQYGIEVRIIK